MFGRKRQRPYRLLVVGVLIVQRVSDGPMEFLQGGSFKTGELVEEPARDYFAPRELGPPPAEPPNDIWFFRMDPRS